VKLRDASEGLGWCRRWGGTGEHRSEARKPPTRQLGVAPAAPSDGRQLEVGPSMAADLDTHERRLGAAHRRWHPCSGWISDVGIYGAKGGGVR
jgi:hypothetical protein